MFEYHLEHILSYTANLWLNRLHGVGVGRVFPERAGVSYDVYAIRVVE